MPEKLVKKMRVDPIRCINLYGNKYTWRVGADSCDGYSGSVSACPLKEYVCWLPYAPWLPVNCRGMGSLDYVKEHSGTVFWPANELYVREEIPCFQCHHSLSVPNSSLESARTTELCACTKPGSRVFKCCKVSNIVAYFFLAQLSNLCKENGVNKGDSHPFWFSPTFYSDKDAWGVLILVHLKWYVMGETVGERDGLEHRMIHTCEYTLMKPLPSMLT